MRSVPGPERAGACERAGRGGRAAAPRPGCRPGHLPGAGVLGTGPPLLTVGAGALVVTSYLVTVFGNVPVNGRIGNGRPSTSSGVDRAARLPPRSSRW
ncbi:DUF1772 domain-containing protein [Actinomycetes bacterium KLBMP 9759]